MILPFDYFRLKRSSRVFMKLFQRMLLPININPLTGTKSSGAATFGAMDDVVILIITYKIILLSYA